MPWNNAGTLVGAYALALALVGGLIALGAHMAVGALQTPSSDTEANTAAPSRIVQAIEDSRSIRAALAKPVTPPPLPKAVATPNSVPYAEMARARAKEVSAARRAQKPRIPSRRRPQTETALSETSAPVWVKDHGAF
jgi:type IV secretory pathway VirB10-like protein